MRAKRDQYAEMQEVVAEAGDGEEAIVAYEQHRRSTAPRTHCRRVRRVVDTRCRLLEPD